MKIGTYYTSLNWERQKKSKQGSKKRKVTLTFPSFSFTVDIWKRENEKVTYFFGHCKDFLNRAGILGIDNAELAMQLKTRYLNNAE